MKLWLVLLAVVSVAWGQSSTQTTLQDPPEDADRVVLLRLGIGDKAETKWDGSVSVTGGELVRVIGYEMRVGDFVHPPRRWEASTRPAFEFQRRPHDEGWLTDLPAPVYLTPRIYLYLRGGEEVAAEVTTAEGNFSFRVSELPPAGTKSLLDGRVTAERVAMPLLAGRGVESADDVRLTENDYPSLTVTENGDVWVAWQGFVPNQDRVYAEKLGTGGSPHAVSGAKGDVFRSAIAEDTEGKIWVVWSERKSDNWDLYARSFDGSSWSSIERLTKASQPDTQHTLRRAPDGRIHLVWQGYRNNNAVVLHKEYDVEAGWSAESRVSADGGNCWEPSLAIDSKGNLTVAWDQYSPNSYDVKLRQRRGANWQDVVTVAGTARFEAYVSVTADADDRVWVAWHESGVNWGKDWGYPYDIREKATGLYNSRNIRMAVYENGNLQAPAQQLEEALPPGGANFYEYPALAADGDGRIWCFFRHRRPMQHNVYNRTPAHHALWEIYASHYDGSRWSPMMLVPYSTGRTDMRIGLAKTPGGDLMGTWATDRRNFRDFISSMTDVFAAKFDAPGAVSTTSLTAYQPKPASAETVHDDESADVARMRGYRYEAGGKTYRVHRGDMHRHTEFSWDGYSDGSLEDTYRYAIDAAGMDFLAVTEHNFGVEDEYNWWLVQKAADIYRIGNKFVPLFAYERSVKYPNGHRNIVFSYRGAPVLDVQHYEWYPQSGYKMEGAEKLFGYLRRYKGIAMPHTSGTSMGTDWRDYDPEFEPVVEIYQSDRTSYECVDCWRAADPNVTKKQYGGYYPEGMVSEAWKKGYRLGVQASSDHLGVHTAYSMILAPDNSRQSLVDAIRARHTYGATDNILLDMRLIGDDREYLMGDEAEVSSPPRFRIHVEGTRDLQDVEIVKDNQRVLSRQPEGSVADFEYRDTETPGDEASFYYLRVRQKDGEIGWGSPIWVTGK